VRTQLATQRTHLRTTRTGVHVVRERMRLDERVTSRMPTSHSTRSSRLAAAKLSRVYGTRAEFDWEKTGFLENFKGV